MSSITEPTIALLASPRTERRLRQLLHPRLASVLVPGVVALTAALLYAWWPAGVLVGCVASALAVLAVGVVMQRAERQAPVAEDLVLRLGLRERAPEPAPVVQTPAMPVVSIAAAQLVVTPQVDERAARAVVEAAAVAQREAEEAALTPVIEQTAARAATGHQADLERLRVELGDDFDDFTRAARLVVESQYASAARLQRELGVSYSRARRLLDDLETEHFVGPATGTLPRQVMVPKDSLAELERILVSA